MKPAVEVALQCLTRIGVQIWEVGYKVFEIWDEHRGANEGGRALHFQHLNLVFTLTLILCVDVLCCVFSVISLATRCAMPSFRMHLRARGKVAQVFKTLNDAPQHPVRVSS